MRISVIGLGKLGSPLAAVMASKGHHVVGMDLNPAYVEAINAGRAPVDEPSLQELIDASQGRLRATSSCQEAIQNSDVTFTIVPTPTNADRVFSNEYVLESMRQIGEAIREKNGYHVVAVTSTVMPGSTGGIIRDTLERHAGRPVGPTMGLCYNPEFIALGSVIRDMLNPDMILIGESDQRAGDVLQSIYESSCDVKPTFCRMNFVNAELTKISINTFVTTKISYANMLAEICERLPGADVDVVTRAVGSDSRIGVKYLRGALGYGGPCFPRDNVAFAALAQGLGAGAAVAEATDRVNWRQVDRLFSLVRTRLGKRGTVGILGLAYKPETGVVEASQPVLLARRLVEAGYSVVAYDPKALPGATAFVGPKLRAAESAERCARESDMVFIATAWSEFRSLSPEAFARDTGRVTVVDCWRLLSRAAFNQVADVVYLGVGLDEGTGASQQTSDLAASNAR